MDTHFPTTTSLTERLIETYARLHIHYGHEPHWWPIFGPLRRWEIVLGALLVQQSRWERVEAAIMRLLAAEWYTPAALATVEPDALVPLLVGVAYPRQKAPWLIGMARHVMARSGGDVQQWLAGPLPERRREFLALPGVGPETADAVLLYAGDHPVFVVDAYLRRVFARLDLIPNVATLPYEQLRALIETALPPTIDLRRWPHLHNDRTAFFWDYHALINEHCIHHCLARRPHCVTTSAPRRPFAQPQKCATHCPPCDGCNLRLGCLSYHQNVGVVPE